jgi:diguanylate cyclase (GGDEF)-like protein
MDETPQICHFLVIEDLYGRRTITLEQAFYSIGRHSSNSIVIYSKQVSRKHAILIRKKHKDFDNNSFFLIDGDGRGNQSNNSIFVNGKKCLVRELQDGDLINFGGRVNASYHILTGHIVEEVPAPERSHQSDREAKTTLKNISEQEETAIKPVYQDWLTGLANRTLFHEHLSLAIANAQDKQQQFALIYLDVEQFEKINQKLGYSNGDRLLKELGQRIESCLRVGDVVARWGGDEFAILLKQVNTSQDPSAVSKRILNALKLPFVVEKSVYLRCNMGIAIYPQNGEDASSLLKTAKLNLESNKKSDRPLLPLAPLPPRASDPQLQRQESILRHAIEREQLALYYQPQVNIHTGEIYGMEALLRWHHPKMGTIYPQQFISWAEKSSLIVPLAEWVLRAACLQSQVWHSAGLPRLPIAVNLSPRQFQQKHLVETIERILNDTGLDPYWLELEVTEQAILSNLNLTRQTLQRLSQLGVAVSLDDFGTGYGAIGYLQEFSLAKLKIAQACVRQLSTNPRSKATIATAIALGTNFNLRVVAEGVETQQQLDLLRALQCQEMQGYRFSQPVCSQDATQFLARHWIVRSKLGQKTILVD